MNKFIVLLIVLLIFPTVLFSQATIKSDEELALLGNSGAAFRLGARYLNGDGVAVDYEKAKYYLEIAAEQNHAHALYDLGYMYLYGEGVAQNYLMAYDYFERSSDFDFAPAFYIIGIMYYDGAGVKKNNKKAYEYCKKAFEKGYIDNLDSFDRLVPNQDKTQDTNKFGSLIALPLSGKMASQNTTIFVDKYFEKYQNQFGYLASVKKVDLFTYNQLLNKIYEEEKKNESLLGKKIFFEAKDFKKGLTLLIDNTIRINKSKLTKVSLNYLKSISSLYNPTYFEYQSKGLSTFKEPIFFKLYEEDDLEISLPRGVLDTLINALNLKHVDYKIIDKRIEGEVIDINFLGTLKTEQAKTQKVMLEKDNGILVAPTAFGKTILAISLMSEIKRNTLILVEKLTLIDQWKEKILSFTDLKEEDIGIFKTGKRKLTGKVDIVSIKSLESKEMDESIYSKYGLVIIDEVHHVAADTLLSSVRKLHSRRMYGLTATLKRSDKNENRIKKLLGDVLYEVKETNSSF